MVTKGVRLTVSADWLVLGWEVLMSAGNTLLGFTWVCSVRPAIFSGSGAETQLMPTYYF